MFTITKDDKGFRILYGDVYENNGKVELQLDSINEFWEVKVDYKDGRKVLVIPNITNASNIEKILLWMYYTTTLFRLDKVGEYFMSFYQNVKLNLENVKQHILPFSGDMMNQKFPDFIKLMKDVEYDVIYSHLPDWVQVGRYKKNIDTKIIGYCHW